MKQKLYYLLALTFLLIIGGGKSVVHAETSEFSDFSAILNNGTGTLITSDEIANKSAVSFGISVDGDGNAVRVAADSPQAIATVSGTYYNEHGLTGFKTVVNVPGNVKITLGTCNWGSDVTIKNSSNVVVASVNTNNGTCYHGNTSANKVSVNYEGEATTLTIEGGSYVPFISIESIKAAEAEFSDFSAILNNGTGTLITSDEITSKSAVSFGISVDGDGNAVRVAADSPLAFATVSGTYHSEHGLTGFKTVVNVPGNVKITLGTCQWGGNVTIKNSSNETVATVNTNNGTCYHGNTSANKVSVNYEGEATTLTIEGGSYVPFISIESIKSAEAEFSDFSAILNNGTGTLITSDEITNKSAVSFGISVDGEGNAVRVAADSPLAFATVSGTYHSEHGLTGFKTVVNVPGNVKIKLGTCNWGGNVTIKNSSNETVATANTNNGTCYHSNPSANKVTVYYEGEATTLTIEGGNYVPFISIESVGNLSKYNVTFKNGEETVDSRTVYNDGIEAQAIGVLPSAAAEQGKQFIGWYTKTDGTGEFATASTVPTSDITYYANYVNLDIENGYVVVDNSGTNRRNGENFLGALAYANANASQNSPVKIFLKNGTYDLGDDAETTQLTGSYVSIIGESLDGTVITNVPTQEGLGTATLLYNKGQYNYLQDLTLHNNYPYGNSTGRAASLKDEGNYTICNNVWLYSHQDTYYSHQNHSKFYFKGGKISGCVDYMCGQSRVYFDGVTLSNDNKTTYMTANSELYVFNNCTVENGGSTYYFGRAWSATADFGDPVCVFLNTTLKDNGSNLASTRWNPENMNTTYAEGTGEYGTMNASGSNITPAENEVQFTYNEDKVKKDGNRFNTILTAEQAATYTIEYTLGDWATTAASDVAQATVSNVKLNGNTLSWTGTSEAYLIENDGVFVALTAENSYTINGEGEYSVRAANARGGFGEAVTVTCETITTNNTHGNASHVSTHALDFSGVEGLTAYIASSADGSGITLAQVDAVPAGTAFVVQATEKAEQKYYIPTTTEEPQIGTNVFQGSNTETATAGSATYALSKSKGMFAKVKSGVTIPTGVAYVNISSGAKETLLFFFDGETTGIVDVDAAEAKKSGVRKLFINGQLMLINGDRQYNAAGGEF